MKKPKNKGFTLAEILAVLVIISILALLALPAIIKYVYQGKDSYNDKLSGQLEISGKAYFSDHGDQLPVNKSYAYVTLPEMQSNNYITNEFKDAEGNECSSSYVYVKAKTYGSNDFEYIPCLICKDENGNVTYRSESEYCQITEWDDTAPTCTYKQVSYSDSNSLYITDAKDMVNETKQGKINSIIITDITTRKQHVVNTKNKDVSTINIKKEVEKYFGKQSGHNFEARVADANYNVSNVCMRFTSCIELDNKEYTRGQTLEEPYANGYWTVVKDNGDSVSLAYNGVFGAGGYSNAVDYLTNNFLNPNKVLKDGRQYGCLVDQGTDKYISTDAQISEGYNQTNYWTDSTHFYNKNLINHYGLSYTAYAYGTTDLTSNDAGVAGMNARLKAVPTGYYVAAITSGNSIVSTSSANYNISGGTITYKNTGVYGPNPDIIGSAEITQAVPGSSYPAITSNNGYSTYSSCSAGSSNICIRMHHYFVKGGASPYFEYSHSSQQETTKTYVYVECGGAHGTTRSFTAKNGSKYKYNGSDMSYGSGYTIFFAGNEYTKCGSTKVNCTGSSGNYVRTYNYSSSSTCVSTLSYGLSNGSGGTLSYRPYIIVKKS